MENIENNKVWMSGEIVSELEYSHDVLGEGFYIFELKTKRASENVDIVKCMISERIIDIKASFIGERVNIQGEFRSFNRDGKVVLTVFVKYIEHPLEEVDYDNIFLDGYICKTPKYRKTPRGIEIVDFIMAVNRRYGKTDYIPCIAWGRNAVYVSGLEVGTRLQIEGRIQSREYQKRISEEETETRIAYEVSTSKLTVVEETEE